MVTPLVAPLAADTRWRQRTRNSLLFLAAADAVAAPLSGGRLPDAATVDVLMQSPPQPLLLSPGVTQAVVLAEHLAQRQGGLDEDELAVGLARQWTIDGRDASTGTGKVLSAIDSGTPWWECAPAPHGRRGSYGNGAAMRAAAVGLLPRMGVGIIAQLARRSATVTHTHPLARDGAAIQAMAVALAAHGHPSPALDTARFIATISSHVRTPEMRASLGIVRTLVRHRAGPVEVAATVGSDHTALRSVPAALAAFLRYPDDPWAVVRFALLMGGQTRAIAAMAAAMAGARCPQYVMPANWRPDLAHTIRLRTAAAALADLDQ